MSTQLTPWFPHEIKPVRDGVYEVQYDLGTEEIFCGYAYWTGNRWTNALSTVDGAYQRRDWVEGAIQKKSWRGLTKEVV